MPEIEITNRAWVGDVGIFETPFNLIAEIRIRVSLTGNRIICRRTEDIAAASEPTVVKIIYWCGQDSVDI